MKFLALIFGIALTSGTLLMLDFLRLRRVPLLMRVGPYIRADSQSLRVAGSQRLDFRQFLTAHTDKFRGLLAPNEELEKNLGLLSEPISLAAFRERQVNTVVLTFIGCSLLSVLLRHTRQAPIVALLLLVLTCLVCALWLPEYFVSKEVTRNKRLMVDEFTAVGELLTIGVNAGMGPLAALESAVSNSEGHLSRQLRHVVIRVKNGDNLGAALTELAQRLQMSVIDSFSEAITVALERGTPLADVLSGQVADARSSAHEDLLNVASKKEILMMLPVVFVILPITVVFALFPGFMTLNLNFLSG